MTHLDSYRIETQVTFPALDKHDLDSRVDMVVQLWNGAREELVFVESKVGSHAGDTQLSRYLDQLAHRREGVNRATLVFVTRHFEADYAEEFMRMGELPAGCSLSPVTLV